jgi:hypothetical protein
MKALRNRILNSWHLLVPCAFGYLLALIFRWHDIEYVCIGAGLGAFIMASEWHPRLLNAVHGVYVALMDLFGDYEMQKQFQDRDKEVVELKSFPGFPKSEPWKFRHDQKLADQARAALKEFTEGRKLTL